MYDVVEVMPQFPGGNAEMMKFLKENIRYPKEAHEKNIQGRVIVRFIVNEDGQVSDAKVARSVDPLLDAEALRVVNSMPKWTPGKQDGKDGKAVKVQYHLPLSFQLNGSSKGKATGDSSGLTLASPISSSKAYVVVDGKHVTDISHIKPDDIESINVKSATDKYGENGKNGVIEITMKKK